MTNDDLALPEGLQLDPIGPSWLTSVWPMTNLDSSIGSIISTLSIYAGLFFAALILAYFSKTFLPRFLNKFFSFAFLMASVAVVVSAGFAFTTWNQEKGIGDKAMGIEVTKTLAWLPTQNASMDSDSTWKLVCFYYDGKNKNCTGESPTAIVKGQKVQVHLEKSPNGKFYLYDFKNKIPLNAQ